MLFGLELSTLKLRGWIPHVVAIAMMLIAYPGSATDRHGGYYYPPDHTSETYIARTDALADVGRSQRIAFATDFMNRMMTRPYPPRFALFVKGDDAQKMIITALQADSLDTIYRMRALLALLTVRARDTELFKTLNVIDVFTFFDLLKLMGFERLTVTDGETFAHQINIK